MTLPATTPGKAALAVLLVLALAGCEALRPIPAALPAQAVEAAPPAPHG